jgi:hypothetical protein
VQLYHRQEGYRIKIGPVVGGYDTTWTPKEVDAWEAAAKFTQNRIGQIADMEEEIAWISGEAFKLTAPGKHPPIQLKAALNRILTREQAALTELRNGMK